MQNGVFFNCKGCKIIIQSSKFNFKLNAFNRKFKYDYVIREKMKVLLFSSLRLFNDIFFAFIFSWHGKAVEIKHIKWVYMLWIEWKKVL